MNTWKTQAKTPATNELAVIELSNREMAYLHGLGDNEIVNRKKNNVL